MNSKHGRASSALTLFAVLATPVSLAAQDFAKQHHHHHYHHYQLVDPGTFGGADSSQLQPNPKGDVNNRGVAVGGADTSTPDPTSTCFNGDCYISYGFKWQDGILHQLGALPGFNSSVAFAVSNNGHVVGLSENGTDPLTGGRALEAVSWGEDGSIRDLGTFGGNESEASAVNNRGEVVGAALNTIPDPYAGFFFPAGATQSHAFRWTNSAGMQDLGTLGGADSIAVYINDRGQISGYSFTDSTVNPVTGLPTTHPFLWENGTMTDLGTLGGSFAGPGGGLESVGGLNNRGDVIGTSTLAGDVTAHPFLWTKSGGMQDLGTLPGGTFGAFATWVNDAREVVGLSATSDALHAFLWRDGVMTDLKTVGNDPSSEANSINSRGQVVGTSFGCCGDLHGFLWEDGGSIVDLNTLVSPRSNVFVPSAIGINERGEIAARGVLPNGDQHTVLLIPCDEGHRDVEGCDYSMVDAATAAQSAVPRSVPSGTQRLPQSRGSNRYHIPGYNQLAR